MSSMEARMCLQSVRGYQRSRWRLALCVLLCALSLGVLPALLYMRPALRLVLTHVACPLALATSVLLRVRFLLSLSRLISSPTSSASDTTGAKPATTLEPLRIMRQTVNLSCAARRTSLGRAT